jgi:hypothetical protein
VLTGYQWHHSARIWRAPVLGEAFQATASRPAFRLLLGRENLRLISRADRPQLRRIRSWAAQRALLKLYRDPGGRAAAAGPPRAGPL